MTVNYKEYNEEKMRFFKKHKNNFNCDTSSMDEYGRYTKTYCFEDGAQWYELMSPESKNIKMYSEETKCNINTSVMFLKTEFWSTESGSKYYYEQW